MQFVYCLYYMCVRYDYYGSGTFETTNLKGRAEMNRKLSLLFCVAVFGISGSMFAQNANGIIAPSRMIDWSSAGVEGGIPNRTTVCATLSPGASASQINNAISSCPSGQVVSLAAGTYNLSGMIEFYQKSGVTLRGAGSNETFLVFTGRGSCNGFAAEICIHGSPISISSPNNLANWTGGYSQGTTQITLDNTTNLRVGDLIALDQTNDASDTGSVLFCDASGSCSSEGPGGIYRSGREESQMVTATAINGNVVTISPGLYMANWTSSKSPQAYWPTAMSTMDGIEALSIDSSSDTGSTGIQYGAGIMINAATNSWVKNVRSINAGRAHVWLYLTNHCSVVDSYFYGTQNGTTSEYAIEDDRDSDSLVMNNIFQHIVSPLIIDPASGTVIAYNYTIDDWYYAASGMWPGIMLHGGGTLDLFEGNEGSGFQADAIHGTHNLMTLFRNRFLGWETGKTTNTIPVQVEAYSRFFNVIGNVLGEPGYHTQYEDLAPSGTNGAKSIYVLGWSTGGGGTAGNLADDPRVASTLMRWGNYDTVTNTTHWDSSEVPSALSQYANPVPSSQALPASFFLSSKPSWWGTPWGNPPWPAIGPDVTGGTGPGGHSYDIPAKLCYDNTSKDSNGILNFSATSCYTSSPAPAAPTNLGATAH